MKKTLLYFVCLVACGLSATTAQADLIFSTSNTDPLAGTHLEIQEGGSGSLYTWLSTPPGNRTSGVAFSIRESETSIVNASAHAFDNPPGRWLQAAGGSLNSNGNAVHNAQAVTFDSANGGISSGGLGNFVLLSQIDFVATALGTTNIDFFPHTNSGNGIQYFGVSGNQWNNTVKGTASISVVSAIPEPGSFAAMAVLALAGGMIRRRAR